MRTATLIDKQISAGLEQLGLTQKKAVLSVIKAFADEEDRFETEVGRRIHEYESGAVKGYTLEESAARAIKAYKTSKRK